MSKLANKSVVLVKCETERNETKPIETRTIGTKRNQPKPKIETKFYET